MADITQAQSIIIVGGGNFGAATALSLAKSHKDKVVTLIDTTPLANPRAASHDINKIVRDDYADILYMRMMVKAMQQWREDKLYTEYYHQVGMLRADPGNFSDGSMRNYKKLNVQSRAEWLDVDEVRRRFNGAFADGAFEGLDKVMYNPDCGWAEADKALGAVLQAAQAEGARHHVGDVEKLIFNEGGACVGVQFRGGDEMRADAVLLCTGARTPLLLADSAPDRAELHAGHRVEATGAVSFTGRFTGAQKDKYTGVPVCKNVLPQVKGESMGMTAEGVIKFNCDMSFTNMQLHKPSGQRMSMAPDDEQYATWFNRAFSSRFEKRALSTMRGLYGKEVDGVKIERFRMCWDATTKSHDFLITPHPHCANLFVATGGSFHGWKFLPVIGEYIVDMLFGRLAPEYADRWAWDPVSEDEHRANPTYDVEFDLPEWLDGGMQCTTW
ncbi:hypothetical protein VDGD_01565 [Verticillium dahliae]|nr:6,7-dimethyl-8-ribityllumazine synthase [Verticillium dahliae VDG1]RBQ73551.1 hypothetical protein VDGD_01565 [Verticillium dahliae]